MTTNRVDGPGEAAKENELHVSVRTCDGRNHDPHDGRIPLQKRTRYLGQYPTPDEWVIDDAFALAHFGAASLELRLHERDQLSAGRQEPCDGRHQLADADECRQAADRVLTAITAPVVIDGHAISVSASIGIALYPRDGKDANDLLMLADQAMYEAKRAGRNRYSEYA